MENVGCMVGAEGLVAKSSGDGGPWKPKDDRGRAYACV